MRQQLLEFKLTSRVCRQREMSQTDNVRRVESFRSNENESVEVSSPLRRRVWTSVAKLQVLKDIEVLK